MSKCLTYEPSDVSDWSSPAPETVNDAISRLGNFLRRTWTQVGQNIVGEDTNDFSGNSVSFNFDGTVLAIGANGNSSFRGHVPACGWGTFDGRLS